MTETVFDGPASDASSSLGREILAVATQEIRGLLTGVRAFLVVVMYGGLVLAIGASYLFATGEIEKKLIAERPELAQLDRSKLLDELVKSDSFKNDIAPKLEQYGGQRLIDAVTSGQMPILLLVLLFFSSFALPGLALITGYDRLSEDLHSRYARFVLQRVRRESWVLGRIVGQWLGLLALVVVTHVALTGIASLASDRFDAGPVWAALPFVWVGMALFLLAYVSFVTLFSALLTPPFAVLAVGGMALMALWVLKVFVPAIGLVWMGAWDLRLWLLDPIAVVVFVVHTAVLAAGAVAIIRARDV